MVAQCISSRSSRDDHAARVASNELPAPVPLRLGKLARLRSSGDPSIRVSHRASTSPVAAQEGTTLMRFWIRDAAGVLHEGMNVQGSGGILRGRGADARLRVAIEQASAGQAHGLFEPRPGHVHAYLRKWWGDASKRDIDLRGAVLERAADEPLPNIAPPAGEVC